MRSSVFEQSSKSEDFLKGLSIQVRVLHALMIRELMMRYGRGNIGFLWLILEPMILCAGVIGLRWVIQGHEEHGISLAAILLSGYMPLTLWRHLTNKSILLLRRNVSMLYHHNVTLLDTYLMTMVLEFTGCTVALMVNYSVLLFIGAINPIHDYGLVAAGWCTLGLLSLGFSSFIAIITEHYETSERFIQPMQYLILPISGFFFMVDWLPYEAQRLAWYMPLVHCFELTRAGFFGSTVITYYDIWYPAAWGIGLLGLCLPMMDSVRDQIHVG
jgi:capsular polysaccharide transport system permease protein